MIVHHEFFLPSYVRGFHLITDEILSRLPKLPKTGLFNLFIKHTSAAITINENVDPDVRSDFASFFDYLIPEHMPFLKHTLEGPDDMPAHVKAALLGFSLSIPIIEHQLNLGTWQGIYLCEFRNRATARHFTATIMS